MSLKILITGRPGIGKTTLIKKIVLNLQRESFDGFYTEEIRQKGKRVGFMISDFSNRTGIIAHINCKSKY